METNTPLFDLKNEQTLIKKKKWNLLCNLLIAAMGISSLFIKFFLVDGVLAFRAFTVNGNLFTTVVAVIYVFTEWRDLKQKREKNSPLLYFLKICSAVTEAVIFIVVMLGYLPIFKDNPKITPYHMFCLHVSMPILTVAAFILFNSPCGVLKPHKLLLGCAPILVYAAGVFVAIKTGLLPMELVPYSFLNFDENFLWYMSFALVVILLFGYFWTWLFYRLNLRMAIRWYAEKDIREAQRQRIKELSSADAVKTSVLLLFYGIAGILVTVMLAMSSKTSSQLSNLFLDYIVYDDYIIYEQDYLPADSWEIRDGCLYKGDIAFGDGTEEAANRKIVTFGLNYYRVGYYINSGVATGASDRGLTEPGRFILVTDTVLDGDTDTERVGSALPTDVVEDLLYEMEHTNEYPCLYGEDTIDGDAYRCVYTPILSEDGRILAIARAALKKSSITALIKKYSHFSDIIMVMVALIAFAIVYVVTRLIIDAFASITTYLETVCNGKKPGAPLYLGKGKRMQSLADKVNTLVNRLPLEEATGDAAGKDE